MKTDSIKWQDWDPSIFERARREDHLVFLYLSATWCHWCHVMEKESFEHPEVIRQLSAHFIPVRVDTDRRPDINNRYNMGGWPTVAILTPEGKVLTGETYLPVGSVLQMLLRVHKDYRKEKSGQPGVSIEKSEPKSYRTAGSPSGKIDPKSAYRFGDQIKAAFDTNFGGFSGPVKFPMPHVLELALLLHRRTGKPEFLQMMTQTLDGMRDGEIHDRVDGGFFRYSTSEDWDGPHYEKMLETQAGLLISYLSGFQATGDPRYRITAQEILRYVTTDLWNEKESWFYGSQSADPAYYQLPDEERYTVPSPPVDTTSYTHWNAWMVRGLFKAGLILDETTYRSQALAVLDHLIKRCVNDEGVACHYFDGTASRFGFLADQAVLIHATLDGYEFTGEERWLEASRGTLDCVIERFWDQEADCFSDRVREPVEYGYLNQPVHPLTENAQMAQALLRLEVLTGSEAYRSRAEKILSSFHERHRAYRLHAASYAIAVDQFCHPPLVITILSSLGNHERESFIRAALNLEAPWISIEHLDTEIDAHRIEARGFPVTRETRAYVCSGQRCLPVVYDPEALKETAMQFYGDKE